MKGKLPTSLTCWRVNISHSS